MDNFSLQPSQSVEPRQLKPAELTALAHDIQRWAHELGFSQIGVTDLDMSEASPRLREWLAKGYQGDMAYLKDRAELRMHPEQMVPGALRCISVRMDYLPLKRSDGRQVTAQEELAHEKRRLSQAGEAVVSLYARGRDYHKVMRQRLQQLADRIAESIGPFGHRVFTDSAPLMEVELAHKSGIGWRGKHTLLLNREGGSFFFLGEILIDVPIELRTENMGNCGVCTECIRVCPTGAIVAPYELDARKCISYLTIEHQGAIPLELRALMGNRIYGCDDCQLYCPWNKFAQLSELEDFSPRHDLDSASLLELWAWTEEEFEQRTRGSAIRRVGYERWLRNLAVALGNELASTRNEQIIKALESRATHESALVREHVSWALSRAGQPA